MDSSDKFVKDEEIHICHVTSQKENKVNNLNYEFTYNSHCIFVKTLYIQSIKLKKILCVSKSTIYPLEKEWKYMLKEINYLRVK